MITIVFIGLIGGLITGISPCVLPVLPVIFFAGGAHPRRPYLVVAGLAISFSVFTLLGTVILRSLPVPQDTIRWAGLVVLVLLGIGMIVPRIEGWLEIPFQRLPQLTRLRAAGSDRGGLLLGLALGAVYVPCAGPVLAAITVAGATGKIGGNTIALTVAFAAGTALPLLAFALAGRRITERLASFRLKQRRIRIAAGAIVIALAVALTFDVTDAIQRAIPDYTNSLNAAVNRAANENGSLATGGNATLAACAQQAGNEQLENCGAAPAIAGISAWLNTPDGMTPSLKGKVVLIDFWAYSCINCQRAIPHDTAWYSAYRAAGLDVIGVHTPEYAFEHVQSNVEAGAKRLGITYPIALDNDYTTWNNFGNESWPAEYLIDATGTVRYVTVGEGDYDGTEQLIRELLTQAHPNTALPPATSVRDTTPVNQDQTPETYLDPTRAGNYGGSPALKVGTSTYAYPRSLADDSFALTGTWTADSESVTAGSAAGIRLNYTADDIYLDVGGTGTVTATIGSTTTTYRVAGAPDIYALLSGSTERSGTVTVTLSPGLRAYSFTFG